jgi:hypothetical protein
MLAKLLSKVLPPIACLLSFAAFSQPPTLSDTSGTAPADSAKFSDAEVRAIALLLQQRIDAGSEITFTRSQVAILVTANSELLKGKTAAEGESAARGLALMECQKETTAQIQVCDGKVAPGWRTALLSFLGACVLGGGIYLAAQ